MAEEPSGAFFVFDAEGKGALLSAIVFRSGVGDITSGAPVGHDADPQNTMRGRDHVPARKPGSSGNSNSMKLVYLRVMAFVMLITVLVTAVQYGPAMAGLVAFAQATALMGIANRRPECLGAYTQIADVIQPDTWLPYTVQRSTELSELVRAGIIETDAQFDALADAGGSTVNMPFWNDLDGEEEVLSDQNPLTTSKIDSSQDVAVMINRGKAWKHNDLAKIFSGDDPAGVAATLVGGYWARRMQAMVLAVLKGIFSTAGMAGHLLAINRTATGASVEANWLTGVSWIAASQLLGDHKDTLTASIMHSAVEASLAARGLITFIPESQTAPRIRTFMGKNVIIDDTMPVDVVAGQNRYTTYLFGRNAFALGNSNRAAQENPEGGIGTWGAEMFREALASNSGLITRRRMIVHPRGIKWLGASQVGSTPDNTELGTAANWLRVWDAKKIPVVAIQHNISE